MGTIAGRRRRCCNPLISYLVSKEMSRMLQTSQRVWRDRLSVSFASGQHDFKRAADHARE